MRNIPLVTRNLLICNVLMFLVTLLYGTNASGGFILNDILGLHFFMASDFHIYQLFTYMFMHGGWGHLFFNMFALWMFGMVVERVWGPKKFLFYYISCGLGAGLMQELAQYGTYLVENFAAYQYVVTEYGRRIAMGDYLNLWTTVGASGAIYGILLAFGMIFPDERIFIFPLPVPIKGKWFVLLYAGIELVSAFASQGDGVAHLAHLGGMLFGYLMILYWKKHPASGYGRSNGERIFDSMRNKWEQRNHKGSRNTTTRAGSDQDYNVRKKQEQEEIDRILDKIRKSGYDSLTSEEKQKLFEHSDR
ncbi:rhomboid family intramembrane serine protease [Prevotella sp. oral taxon 376]|uniref:rhomboid family intramembrane serine protease n=1 Tax=Prevotella sp. oral taxon 376 TaxID=712466 RepID=UPI000D1DEFF0|nr:rhomboid family intramembrane serine protease [Prevotella sp. oral taxon 376]PTL33841.1 rhomboid family intramembrane serine protease [Prevotella sp. oral taxon 376]